MQQILGVSKRNPVFYTEYLYDNTINIYYGAQLFTNIINDKNNFHFKSVIATLRGAGIKAKQIRDSFNISSTTITKISKAFECNDDNLLLEKLKNPGRETYKMTDEIFCYIYERKDYYELNGYKYYLSKISNDIETKYKISLSTKKIKQEINKYILQSDLDQDLNSNNKLQNDNNSNIELTPDDSDKSNKSTMNNNQIEISIENNTSPMRNSYAGFFIVLHLLKSIFKNISDQKINIKSQVYSLKKIYINWCAGIILGAKNLEGFRYFNNNDFSVLTETQNIPCVENMRKILHEIKIADNIKITSEIFKSNIQLLSLSSNDYYLDGHFEEYTGKENILSGWNTIKNRVTKGNVDYFVHDRCGNPIFSLLEDNYYSFIDIIRKIIIEIEKLERPGPFVIIYDRGGFSTDLMKEISEKENQFFITWQKGFKKEETAGKDFIKKTKINLDYNILGKYKTYDIYYTEDKWTCKEYTCRRILIKRINQKNKKFKFSSILTNDLTDNAEGIIYKILNRFKQENDFKKQKAHFGLDEITSYKKLEYNEMKSKDQNKEAVNYKYMSLSKDNKKLIEKRKKIFDKIGMKIFPYTKNNKMDTKVAIKYQEDIEKIKEINATIKKNKKMQKEIKKKINKIEQCQNENKKEFDLRAKRILGLIKITARNIFNKLAMSFLEEYKNLRDYQKVFRKIVQTGGEIVVKKNNLIVRIDSFGKQNFQKKIQKYFNTISNNQIEYNNINYNLIIEWRNN